MRYYWGPGKILDGKLDGNCGRIVIYEDKAVAGFNPTMDHLYLLNGLAAKYRFKKEDVISNAVRLYFRNEGDYIIICGRRKVDDEAVERNLPFYAKIIKDALR
jgi:hypothetical protein